MCFVAQNNEKNGKYVSKLNYFCDQLSAQTVLLG